MDDRPLDVRPEYQAVRNEVLQPDRSVTISRYFLENWAPRLGPTLTAIIIRLRTYVQDNETAQRMQVDGRKWQPVFPTQKHLAAEIGISERTLRRSLEHPAAELFIKQIRRTMKDDKTGEIRRLPDAYAVAMDDVPTVEDERKIALLAAERLVAERSIPRSGQNDRIGDLPPRSGQIDRNVLTLSLNAKENNVIKRISPNVDNSNRQEHVQDIARMLTEELDDPTSWQFYLRIAWRLPEETIFSALSETKDAHLSGRIKRNRGACFTDIIKRKSRECGVEL